MKIKFTTWDHSPQTRYWIDKLPSESFGEKAAYQICRIDRSTNLQRGFVDLDPRWERDEWKNSESQEEIAEAIKSAPANIKRILKRFLVTH